MKRINNRKVRIGMTLQQLKNGRVVSTTVKTIKDRILADIEASPLSEFKIIVTYSKGLSNSGHYYSKKDLVFALNAFTSKPQLDYIEQYWG